LAIFKRLYKSEVNERGKSFMDYVHDTIERHIKKEDHYDPDKSPLEYHLKYHVLRRALYNDLPPHVRKQYKSNREGVASESNLMPKAVIAMEPLTDAVILELDEFDQKVIFGRIEKEIDGDRTLESLYLAVCQDTFKLSDRSEICKEYDLTLPEFDNGKRRFITILKNVFRELKVI